MDPSNSMSAAKDAHSFDPDLQPWERQPNETDDAYAMYVAYRDMPSRNMALFDQDPEHVSRGFTTKKAHNNSSRWSWAWRNAQYDRYLANVDVEELVRYRRMMHERHRRVARAGFSKMTQWVRNFDINRLTASEAIRLFEVFVRVEQMAAGTYEVLDQMPGHPDEQVGPVTIGDLIPGIDPSVEEDLARVLDRIIRSGDSVPGQEWKRWEPPV
jgi:hypothetical protein